MNNIQRSDLLFKASNECIKHAELSFKNGSWNMSIRRSQEAVEMNLTAILALIGIHYPKDHDQAQLAMRVLNANGYGLGEKDATKIEQISIDLSRKRGPALHQEEGYNMENAEKALADADFVISMIDQVKNKILQEQTK